MYSVVHKVQLTDAATNFSSWALFLRAIVLYLGFLFKRYISIAATATKYFR